MNISNNEIIEKRKLELMEEKSFIDIMVLASCIKKQSPDLMTIYDREILRVADTRLRLMYNIK